MAEDMGHTRATRSKGFRKLLVGLLQTRDDRSALCGSAEQCSTQRQKLLRRAYRPASNKRTPRASSSFKPWSRIEQALRTADLLLQGGGFSAIVLDMGSMAPEFISRVPLATWFRYRAAAERTQSSILASDAACSSQRAVPNYCFDFSRQKRLCHEATVFTGIKPHVEVARRRFTEA